MRQAIQAIRIPEIIVALLAISCVIVLFCIDIRMGVAVNTTPLYPPILLLCLTRRNRAVLWAVAVCALISTAAAYPIEHGDTRSLVHRAMAMVALLGTATVVDMFMRSRRLIEAHERLLDQRRREAEEASVRKSRFLAAVSHDIRTPANAISLIAELMLRTAHEPDGAREIPELATDLKRSAVNLVNLVSDVLDLTRFDSGGVDLNETDFALAAVIAEECRPLQKAAAGKGVSLECSVADTALRVHLDRVKLSRILTNLIGNAIKFTDCGKIDVTVEREGDAVAIRVIDTGCGIPPEHLERIFDEFFQLKNPHRDREQGSGLGLAICKRLINAMGGRIEVHSEAGKGSRFSVILPSTAVLPE